jgi:outer membrane protein TolC
LLGDPQGVGASLAAADVPAEPAADEPVEALAISDALQSSYAQKQLQTELALVKDQLTIAGDPLRPRLDVDAYVQAQGLGNRRVPPALEQFGKMEAVSAHVGLTFEMPVTDTRRSSQIAAARLSTHIAEKRLAESELQIRSSVASAIARRRAARERLVLSRETEKVALKQAEAERARAPPGPASGAARSHRLGAGGRSARRATRALATPVRRSHRQVACGRARYADRARPK